MAGAFFLLLLLAVIGMPEAANAVDRIELNRNYTVQFDSGQDSYLYEFTIPEAGNIRIQAKNADPAGTGKVIMHLYDSNNRVLTASDSIRVNAELPVYSTDGNRTFYVLVNNSAEAVHLF